MGPRTAGHLRVGIAHHLGWAVAVTATPAGQVVDRRRIELVEPGVPVAPVHHEGSAHPLHRRGEPLADDALAALVAEVRASAARASAVALDGLAADLPQPVASISIRAWPTDFPTDVAVQRRAPYEARADSVLYRQVLAEAAAARGWVVHRYEADVERRAAAALGARADEVLRGPRTVLGPPWAADHRMALAATLLAG